MQALPSRFMTSTFRKQLQMLSGYARSDGGAGLCLPGIPGSLSLPGTDGIDAGWGPGVCPGGGQSLRARDGHSVCDGVARYPAVCGPVSAAIYCPGDPEWYGLFVAGCRVIARTNALSVERSRHPAPSVFVERQCRHRSAHGGAVRVHFELRPRFPHLAAYIA